MYRAYCSSLEKMAAAVDGENGETKESTQTLDSEEKEGPKMRKDFKSALIILPPETVWQQIQDIRR